MRGPAAEPASMSGSAAQSIDGEDGDEGNTSLTAPVITIFNSVSEMR